LACLVVADALAAAIVEFILCVHGLILPFSPQKVNGAPERSYFSPVVTTPSMMFFWARKNMITGGIV
jgi:hypothetical protein